MNACLIRISAYSPKEISYMGKYAQLYRNILLCLLPLKFHWFINIPHILPDISYHCFPFITVHGLG